MKKINLAAILFSKKEEKLRVYEAALKKIADQEPLAQEALDVADDIMETTIGDETDARKIVEQIYAKSSGFIQSIEEK